MLDSCSIIIRKPFGNEAATLGIRAAWAMLSNASLEIKIVLMGDGVYSVLGKSGYVKDMFKRFLSEDGEVYAIKEDLVERFVDEDSLPEGVQVIPASEISELVNDTNSVMTF